MSWDSFFLSYRFKDVKPTNQSSLGHTVQKIKKKSFFIIFNFTTLIRRELAIDISVSAWSKTIMQVGIPYHTIYYIPIGKISK